MPVEHLNITLPIPMKHALDKEAKRERTKRSTLIQKAVSLYLRVAEKKSLHELLREGYLEMASEMREVTKSFDALDRESLKYAD